MVEEDQARAGGGNGRNNFIELSSAHQSRGIWPAPALDQDRCDGCARRSSEFLELGQRCIEVQIDGRLRWRGRNLRLLVKVICSSIALRDRGRGACLLRYARWAKAVRGELNSNQDSAFTRSALA